MESIVAAFEKMSVQVVGREFPQILLIHASQMNADLMPDLLAMFRRRGYTFVTLDHALADPAYRLPDDYAGAAASPGSIAGRWPRESSPRRSPIRPPGFRRGTRPPPNKTYWRGLHRAIDW